jgi:hypothetical protein
MKKLLFTILIVLPFALIAQNMPEIVKKFTVSANNSLPYNITNFKDTVYFLVNNDQGTQLWKTTGTENGTTIVYLGLNDNEKIVGNIVSNGEFIYFFTKEEETLRLKNFDGLQVNTEESNFSFDLSGSSPIMIDDVQLNGNTLWFRMTQNGITYRNRYLFSTSLNSKYWHSQLEKIVDSNDTIQKKEFLADEFAYFLSVQPSTRNNASYHAIFDEIAGFDDLKNRREEDGGLSLDTFNLGQPKSALGILNDAFYFVSKASNDSSTLYAAFVMDTIIDNVTTQKMGTRMVKNDVKAYSLGQPFQGKLFFFGADSTIWQTNGSDVGTYSTNLKGATLDAAGNRLFYTKTTTKTLFEWIDNTEKAISGLKEDENILQFMTLNGKAYLISDKKQLYRIDSTALVAIGELSGFEGDYTTLNDSTVVFRGAVNTSETGLYKLSLNLNTPQKPDLSLTLSADRTDLPLYDYFNFIVTIKNTGGTDAHGIKASVPFFDAQIVRANSSEASKGIYSTYYETWSIDTLKAGDSATLRVRAFVNATTPLSRFAQIIAQNEEDLDSKPNNNTTRTPQENDEALLNLPDVNNVTDLGVTLKSSFETFRKYSYINYSIAVKNEGDVSASNIKVSFPFPEKTVNGGFAAPSVGKWEEWCSGNIQCYTWTIPNLNAHQTANLEVPLFIMNPDSPIVATVHISSLIPTDNNKNNDTATVIVKPQPTLEGKFLGQNQRIPVVIQKISPVPADDLLNIQLESLTDQEVTFAVSDATGKTILTEKRALEKGRNQVELMVSTLPQGLYLIQVSSNRLKNMPLKFVKM